MSCMERADVPATRLERSVETPHDETYKGVSRTIFIVDVADKDIIVSQTTRNIHEAFSSRRGLMPHRSCRWIGLTLFPVTGCFFSFIDQFVYDCFQVVSHFL